MTVEASQLPQIGITDVEHIKVSIFTMVEIMPFKCNAELPNKSGSYVTALLRDYYSNRMNLSVRYDTMTIF